MRQGLAGFGLVPKPGGSHSAGGTAGASVCGGIWRGSSISLSIATPVAGMLPLVRRVAGFGGVAGGSTLNTEPGGSQKCYTCARSLLG